MQLTQKETSLIKDLKETNRTNTAGRTLTAGLVYCELKEELSDINHTRIFVHYDKSA